MAFVEVPDRAAGYAPVEADWDTYIRDNMNSGTWVLLADSTLTTTAASIDFTSIDQTFAHLRIVAYLRGTDAAVTIGANLRFNADSAANYDYQTLTGGVSTAAAVETFAASFAYLELAPGAGAGANLYSAHTTAIPHYANATNNKVALTSVASKAATTSGGMQVAKLAGFWRSSAAISQVTILPSAGSWAAGSRATIYALA